jgi:hypothetical protein
LCTCHRQYPGAATGCLVCSLPQPYQPSPIRVPGRPTHRPFRGLLGVHSRYGLHTRTVTVFRDGFTEGFNRFVTSTVAPVASGWSISPGGTLTHWKAPPFHGAPRKQPVTNVVFGPRLCENTRAPFSGVSFSHVEAISADSSHRIRVVSILRGERNEFSHSLGREPPDRQHAQCGQDRTSSSQC